MRKTYFNTNLTGSTTHCYTKKLRMSNRNVARLACCDLIDIAMGSIDACWSTRRQAYRVDKMRQHGRTMGTKLRIFANAKQRREYCRSMKLPQNRLSGMMNWHK